MKRYDEPTWELTADEYRELFELASKTSDTGWRVYDEMLTLEFKEVEWTWKEYTIATITLIAIIILI